MTAWLPDLPALHFQEWVLIAAEADKLACFGNGHYGSPDHQGCVLIAAQTDNLTHLVIPGRSTGGNSD